MKGQFYIPNEQVSGLINLIWEQDANESKNWKILPSGFVELIFRIQSNFKIDKDKAHLRQTNPVEKFCFLSGLHTKPLYLSFDRFKVMGVQLHPIAVKALFDIPTYKLRNTAVEGQFIIDELQQLKDVLKSENTFQEKARFLEKWISSKIKETPELYKAMKLSNLLKGLTHKKIKGEDINWQDYTGYSRTQTYRIVKDWYGLSPNHILKLYQFVQSMNELHNSAGKLTDIALKMGYYDQSHFIRSFKEFGEMTPGKYKRNMTPLLGQLTYH